MDLKDFASVRGCAIVGIVLAVLVVLVAGEVVVVLVLVRVVVVVAVCVVVCLVVLLFVRLSAVTSVIAARDTEFRLAMSSSVPWRISWADSGISQIKEEKRLLLEQCEFWRFGRI